MCIRDRSRLGPGTSLVQTCHCGINGGILRAQSDRRFGAGQSGLGRHVHPQRRLAPFLRTTRVYARPVGSDAISYVPSTQLTGCSAFVKREAYPLGDEIVWHVAGSNAPRSLSGHTLEALFCGRETNDVSRATDEDDGILEHTDTWLIARQVSPSLTHPANAAPRREPRA